MSDQAGRSAVAGFTASSDPALGELLAVLAASRPGGRLLELGTGVGIGTASLLRGMDPDARLVTVESEVELSRFARDQIDDPCVTFVTGDGGAWLSAATDSFDLVFADTWPGKFTHLDEGLALVRPGGFYVVDDLDPRPDWPAEHTRAVAELVHELRARPGWVTARIDAASGLMLCTRSAD